MSLSELESMNEVVTLHQMLFYELTFFAEELDYQSAGSVFGTLGVSVSDFGFRHDVASLGVGAPVRAHPAATAGVLGHSPANP